MANSAKTSQLRLQRLAESVAQKSTDSTRHRCFVSYHVADQDEVEQFIKDYGTEFIPTVVGVTADDDFVNSDDTDYIMNRIREEYLGSTTVTMVMIGGCTWARRFVDWEIYASLRAYNTYPISGLVAISLPSMATASSKRLPPRLADNVDDDRKYARWWKYPSSGAGLRKMSDEAFEARSSKVALIDNSRPRKVNNSPCP